MTKHFTVSSTAIAMTVAVGAMVGAATSAHAISTTQFTPGAPRFINPENPLGNRPSPLTPRTSTTASAPAKPATQTQKKPQATTTSTASSSKPDYHNPQTIIDQFKKSPVTASFCEPSHGSACFQKIGIPDGKGGETLLDLHFAGLRGQLLPADKARLDKALADAEKVYLSRPGGGTPPLDIHKVHRAN